MSKPGKIDSLSESIGQLKAISEEHGKKLDDISINLRETNSILRDNTASLQEHMFQTKLTQEQNKILKEEHLAFMGVMDRQLRGIDERIRPVEEHIQNLRGITKLGKFLVPLVGFPAGLYYLFKLLSDYILPWLHK